MPERNSVTQSVAIGKELTPGVGVATNRKLAGISIEPAIEFEGDMFSAMGVKYGTVFSPNKEWTSASIKGKPLYNEVAILLEGAVKKATAVRLIPSTGLAYSRIYTSAHTTADDVQTFSIEQGDAVRAHKMNYGMIKELGFTFTRSSLDVSGSMMGRILTDNIVLTAAPTSLPVLPVLPTQVTLKIASTQAGLTAAPALTRPFTVEWKLSDRFSPLWVLNAANSSWVAPIETKPKLTMKLKMEADAEGMGLLTALRAGTKQFLEIKCVTTSFIEATTPYTLIFQTSTNIVKPNKFEDTDGVYAIAWDFEAVYDETWGKAFEITSICTTADLFA